MTAATKTSTKVIHVAAAAIFADDGRLLIAKRPDHAHQGGLWEFPGGKVEPGESVQQALARELEEEVGIEIDALHPLIRIPHCYPDKTVLLDVWRVTAFTGQPQGREGQPLRWVQVDELQASEFPAANAPIIDALKLPDHYLITGEFSDRDDFLAKLNSALDNGVKLVQLRAKSLSESAYRDWAQQALACCHRAGAALILNGDPRRLADIDAQGIHLSVALLDSLTQVDLQPWQQRWVGASCHSPEQLQQAVSLGVNYVSLSPVQSTCSHPQTPALGWSQFARWVDAVPVPVYALGGMSSEDIPCAIACGGQGVAAIGAYWGK